MVKGEQLAFPSPISHPMRSEAHVSWRRRWYITCPPLALCLMAVLACNDCWSVDVMVRGPIVIYLYAGVMTIYWLCCFGLSVCCCHGSLPQAVLAKGVFHSTDILLLC